MGKKAKGVPVTMRALVQRINRKLKADDEQLKATRGGRAQQELGEFYVLRLGGAAGRNIVDTHVDPEERGRELGALQPWERVVEGGDDA